MGTDIRDQSMIEAVAESNKLTTDQIRSLLGKGCTILRGLRDDELTAAFKLVQSIKNPNKAAQSLAQLIEISAPLRPKLRGEMRVLARIAVPIDQRPGTLLDRNKMLDEVSKTDFQKLKTYTELVDTVEHLEVLIGLSTKRLGTLKKSLDTGSAMLIDRAGFDKAISTHAQLIAQYHKLRVDLGLVKVRALEVDVNVKHQFDAALSLSEKLFGSKDRASDVTATILTETRKLAIEHQDDVIDVSFTSTKVKDDALADYIFRKLDD
jgi:hypothetical protein